MRCLLETFPEGKLGVVACPILDCDVSRYTPSGTGWVLDQDVGDCVQDGPTPRQEYELRLGPISDNDWQWLKEFCERNHIPRR